MTTYFSLSVVNHIAFKRLTSFLFLLIVNKDFFDIILKIKLQVINGDVAQTQLRIHALEKDHEYSFRIRAQNKHGISEALTTETVKTCYSFGNYSINIKLVV